jgi:hypothetical protein
MAAPSQPVFAFWMHIFLLCVDGVLFVWAVLYLAVQSIKEYFR